MADPTSLSGPPAPSKPAPTPEEPYARSYGILFQTWLILFLVVVCFALVSYLMYFIR